MFLKRGGFMVINTSRVLARKILKDINNKKIILYERDKNIEFIEKYSISTETINEIIYSLTEDYFIERIDNKDPKIKCIYLYVFNVIYEFTDIYGESLKKVYIKIGEIEEGILLVSFHDIDYY